MSNLVEQFCLNCKKDKCKYGHCSELTNYVKELYKNKVIKKRGGHKLKRAN